MNIFGSRISTPNESTPLLSKPSVPLQPKSSWVQSAVKSAKQSVQSAKQSASKHIKALNAAKYQEPIGLLPKSTPKDKEVILLPMKSTEKNSTSEKNSTTTSTSQ